MVVTPRSTSEVSEIMKICSRRQIPVTAYSGGTSFSGALTATRQGICIDFKHMHKILAIHEEDLDVVVQPAVGWQDLNALLEPRTNAYRYGTMKDWVTSMTAVLADGTIVKTGHRPRKSSAGYDLSSLLIGSEGTIALVTEAVLKITALARNQHVGVAAFPTTRTAVSAAISLITSDVPVDALELLDTHSLGAINHSGLSSRCWEEVPTLFLRFSGSTQAVDEQIRMAHAAAMANRCAKFQTSGDKEEIEVIWGARKSVAPALIGLKKDPSDLFLHADAAVPISALADMIDWTNRNYHASIICPKAKEVRAMGIIRDIQRRAIQLGGSITGEHGVGLDLRDMLVEEVGENGVNMMRAVNDSMPLIFGSRY
ncbi:MAG: hypothetical protein Q9207_001154 [Kuettlingeria erythrocarpa]